MAKKCHGGIEHAEDKVQLELHKPKNSTIKKILVALGDNQGPPVRSML
jgi:hypothetical protein